MNREDYISLVYRNLKGELSPQEFDKLNIATAKDNRLADLRMDIEDIWDAGQDENQVVTPKDTDQLLKNILAPSTEEKTVETTKIFSIGRIVSGIAALLVLAFGAMFLFGNGTTVYNEAGEYTLADNTRVTLREGSKLTVRKFEDSQRRVELSGEALFDVTSDKKRPFVVSSNHVKISVLGTSFLVKEDNDETYIHLYEGKISVLDTRSLESKILTPGMKTRHSATGKITLLEGYNNLGGWKEGVFEYSNASLISVVQEISKVYETEITIADKALENCILNGIITGKSAKEVLEKIAQRFQMELKPKNSKWILESGRCK